MDTPSDSAKALWLPTISITLPITQLLKHKAYPNASGLLDTLWQGRIDTKAVLYDPSRRAIARRLKSAMDAAKVKNTHLAELCDVSVQAVGGWLKSGRIDKKHFPVVCQAVNRSPEWLTTGLEPESFAVAEAFQRMPQDLKPAFQKVADTFAQSAQLIPWDEKRDPDRRRKEG